MVLIAKKLPCIQSYTVYIFNSGQLYVCYCATAGTLDYGCVWNVLPNLGASARQCATAAALDTALFQTFYKFIKSAVLALKVKTIHSYTIHANARTNTHTHTDAHAHTYIHTHTRTHIDVAESIGRELLVYGRRIPKAELFARIDAVDANTIRQVADRFIYDQVRGSLARVWVCGCGCGLWVCAFL